MFTRPVLYFISQDEIARLSALQPQVDKLHEQLQELRQKEETPVLFDADISAYQEHYHQVLEDLRARERQLVLGEGCLVLCYLG